MLGVSPRLLLANVPPVERSKLARYEDLARHSAIIHLFVT